jgi:hypothetical protein
MLSLVWVGLSYPWSYQTRERERERERLAHLNYWYLFIRFVVCLKCLTNCMRECCWFPVALCGSIQNFVTISMFLHSSVTWALDMAGDIKPINRHWCLRFCKIPLYSKGFFNSKWPQAKNIHEVLYFRFHVFAPFPSILLLISINNLFSVFSGLDNPC